MISAFVYLNRLKTQARIIFFLLLFLKLQLGIIVSLENKNRPHNHKVHNKKKKNVMIILYFFPVALLNQTFVIHF